MSIIDRGPLIHIACKHLSKLRAALPKVDWTVFDERKTIDITHVLLTIDRTQKIEAADTLPETTNYLRSNSSFLFRYSCWSTLLKTCLIAFNLPNQRHQNKISHTLE
jgi:hypothetical protein